MGVSVAVGVGVNVSVGMGVLVEVAVGVAVEVGVKVAVAVGGFTTIATSCTPPRRASPQSSQPKISPTTARPAKLYFTTGNGFGSKSVPQ